MGWNESCAIVYGGGKEEREKTRGHHFKMFCTTTRSTIPLNFAKRPEEGGQFSRQGPIDGRT